MKVLDRHRLVEIEAAGQGAKALFPEAKRRERHRRLLWLGVIVIVVGAAAGIYEAVGGGSATKPPPKKPSQITATHQGHDMLVKGIFRIGGGPAGTPGRNLSGRIDLVRQRAVVDTLGKPAIVFSTHAVNGKWSIAVPPGTYRVCAFSYPRGGDAACPFDTLVVVRPGETAPIRIVEERP